MAIMKEMGTTTLISRSATIPNLIASLCLLFGPPAWSGTASFGIIGDGGDWNKNSREVRDSILRQGVGRLILPGDNLYDLRTSYEDAWGPWLSKKLILDIVAIGNHNLSYAAEVRYFNMPGEYYAAAVPEADALFLVLNSDDSRTAQKQASWFEEQLAGAAERFVFVVYHHPPYTLTENHSWKERAAFHRATRPALWNYRKKISAVIVGHDHVAAAVSADGLPILVSGAVIQAKAMAPVNEYQHGVHVRTEWEYDGTLHWARLDLDSDASSAIVKFIRAKDDVVTCRVRIVPGRRMTLARSRQSCN